MPVLILVEDTTVEAYEYLARRKLALSRSDRSQVKAITIRLGDVATVEAWR
jgi:hypothetical protein